MARSLIQRQLTYQIGALPESVLSQIQQLSMPQLDVLSKAAWEFENLGDLLNWLQAFESSLG